jgi:hypothetical protein
MQLDAERCSTEHLALSTMSSCTAYGGAVKVRLLIRLTKFSITEK